MQALLDIEEQVRREADGVSLSVKAIAVTTDNKVLLLHRPDETRWDLPGGGVDEGESLAKAFMREMWEETGIIRISNVKPISSFLRDIPEKDLKLIQYVLVHLPTSSKNTKIKLSEEHDSYQFWDIDNDDFPILIDSYLRAFKAAKMHLLG